MTLETKKQIEEVAVVGTKKQVVEWLQKDLKAGYELVVIEPVTDPHQNIGLERLRVKPPIVE